MDTLWLWVPDIKFGVLRKSYWSSVIFVNDYYFFTLDDFSMKICIVISKIKSFLHFIIVAIYR